MKTTDKEFIAQLPKDLMKSPRHHIGPANTFIMGITGIIAMGVLLRPAPLDFILILIADFIAGLIYFQIDPYLFRKLRPEYAKIFEGLVSEDFKNASPVERTELLAKIIRFPRIRANYNARVSIIKVVPAALVGIFATHSLGSPEARALVVIPAIALNLCFFYIANYYDYHRFLTFVLNAFHQEVDLTQNFKELEFDTERRHFSYIHWVGIGMMITISVGLNFLVNYNEPSTNVFLRALYSCAISMVGITVFIRTWYMTKSLTLDPMWDVVNEITNVNLGDNPRLLAIHTVPLVSRVQQTILGMKLRLAQSEGELSEYIHQEAEQERYRMLGELTALIAHDLSSPLHAASFFANELRADPALDTKNSAYIDRILKNLDRATNLLLSMRFRLKEENEDVTATSLRKTHEEVLQFLSMQYQAENFARVKVSLLEFEETAFAISNVDFAQILDNLYRNAFSELLSSGVEKPEIRVWSEKLSGEAIGRIFISDNGRGMSLDRFEEMTASTQNRSIHRSLGLRLTRRLIEKHKGKLTVLSDSAKSGATFIITLPLSATHAFHLKTLPTNTQSKELQ